MHTIVTVMILKKLSFILLFILFLSGCTDKKVDYYSDISHQEKNYVSIQYPITTSQVLNDQVKSYIDEHYQRFLKYSKTATEKEFNTSAEYSLINNRYEMVLLTIFNTASSMTHPSTSVKSFVLDKKTNTLLSLKDVLTEKGLEQLKTSLKQKLKETYPNCLFENRLSSFLEEEIQDYSNFTFDDSTLVLYFNPYLLTSGNCGIINSSFKLEMLSLKINIEKEVFEENNQLLKAKEKSIDPNKPVIAFTFDDGPSKYTEDILTEFNKYQGAATFFVIGNKLDAYKKTLQKMVKLGNEIGNHSYNHQWMNRMSEEELTEQINKTQEKITKITGFTPTRIRPTYGALNERIKKTSVLEIALWNVDPKDWKYKNSKTIAERILKKAEDQSIILLHDTHKRSVEAVKIVLRELDKQGYQFVTLGELEEVKLLRKNAS